ncbi:MAG: hypothetical protein J5441_00765 [Clostridia bacterium]|nr:hypothetical protein [Clostridia bacterium]
MTKQKSTKRALISSLLILAMCFTMLAGTTFAWFTDSVTSANNIIKSGKLDVAFEWANGKDDPAAATWKDASQDAIFDYDLWEPGYTEVRHIRIANKGNLALKYKVQIVANGTVSDLAKVIDVYYIDPAQQIADRAAFEAIDASKKLGTLDQALAGMATTASGALVPEGKEGNGLKSSETITIALHMQETAGNEYQDMSIGSSFSVQLLATQYTFEKDSFDDQYDANAAFVSSGAELQTALLDPAVTSVVLKDNIVESLVLRSDKEIDLNGYTLTTQVNAWDGDVTIKNGTIEVAEGEQGIQIWPDSNARPHITIAQDVVINAPNGYAVTIFPEYQSAGDTCDATVDIYGTLNSNLFVSGNIKGGSSVVNVYGTIDGSKNTDNDIGIALNGNSTVNIKAGAVVKGSTGIEVRAGKLNVEGGEITGTATPSSAQANNNGTTTEGAGIAVSSYGISPIDVKVSGGTIKGYNPLYVVNPNGVASYADVKVNVTGGTFECINGGTVQYFKADNVPADITYNVA